MNCTPEQDRINSIVSEILTRGLVYAKDGGIVVENAAIERLAKPLEEANAENKTLNAALDNLRDERNKIQDERDEARRMLEEAHKTIGEANDLLEQNRKMLMAAIGQTDRVALMGADTIDAMLSFVPEGEIHKSVCGVRDALRRVAAITTPEIDKEAL